MDEPQYPRNIFSKLKPEVLFKTLYVVVDLTGEISCLIPVDGRQIKVQHHLHTSDDVYLRHQVFLVKKYHFFFFHIAVIINLAKIQLLY